MNVGLQNVQKRTQSTKTNVQNAQEKHVSNISETS